MNIKILFLALALILIVGLVIAFVRSYRMPLGICYTLIILGALLVIAPTVFSFLLRLFGRDGGVEADNSMLGGIMVFVGIIGAVFSRRAVAAPPK